MSIATIPATIIRHSRGCEITLTPVAFRPSTHHPWRSYGAGNPRYRHNFATHLYLTDPTTHHLILYSYESRTAGFEYETHCVQCGAYTAVVFPEGAIPKDPQVRCLDCIAANTSPDLPQDGMRIYAPEYQAQLRRALEGA